MVACQRGFLLRAGHCQAVSAHCPADSGRWQAFTVQVTVELEVSLNRGRSPCIRVSHHRFEIAHRAPCGDTAFSALPYCCRPLYCLTSGIWILTESDTISEWKYGPRVSTAFAVWPLCAAPTFRLGHCEQIYTCSLFLPHTLR